MRMLLDISFAGFLSFHFFLSILFAGPLNLFILWYSFCIIFLYIYLPFLFLFRIVCWLPEWDPLRVMGQDRWVFSTFFTISLGYKFSTFIIKYKKYKFFPKICVRGNKKQKNVFALFDFLAVLFIKLCLKFCLNFSY